MPMHKGGKKNRKHGRGQDKIAHSRWGSFAALIKHSQERKRARVKARQCGLCDAYCHSKGSLKRHTMRHRNRWGIQA